MEPPSYMRSVVDRNVVMRRLTVLFYLYETKIIFNSVVTAPFLAINRYVFRPLCHSHTQRYFIYAWIF